MNPRTEPNQDDSEEEDFSFLEDGDEKDVSQVFIPSYTFNEEDESIDVNDSGVMIIEPIPLNDMTPAQVESFRKLAVASKCFEFILNHQTNSKIMDEEA